MKKIYVILSILLVAICIFAGCSAPEKIRQAQCWAYDPYEQTEKYLGLVDYLLVVEVAEKTETLFDKELEEPYQKYKVKVKENIKGKLSTDELIDMYAGGGVTPDGKYEYDYGLNKLEGGTYIITGFSASADTGCYKKGDLVAEIAIELPKDYKGNEFYEKWVKAYENEVPFKGFGDE